MKIMDAVDASGVSDVFSASTKIRFPLDITVAADIGSPEQTMKLQASTTVASTTLTVQWSPDGTAWFDGYERTINSTGGTLAEIADTLVVTAAIAVAETFTIKGDYVRIKAGNGGGTVTVWVN